jgi:hypothetical protein
MLYDLIYHYIELKMSNFKLLIFYSCVMYHSNYALWTSNAHIGWLERPKCELPTLDVQCAHWMITHFGRNIYTTLQTNCLSIHNLSLCLKRLTDPAQYCRLIYSTY